MNVDLGSVDGLSAELAVHLLQSDTAVVHLDAFVEVDAVHVPCNRLEEGSTATAGRSKNDKHLARIEHTVKARQDLDLAATVAEVVTSLLQQVVEDVADRLLVVWEALASVIKGLCISRSPHSPASEP